MTPDPIVRVTNKAHPALRIVKYDGNTKQPIPNTKFEVYRDSTLIGEYVTDAKGEVNLYDLEPGTYRVQEVATASTHVVNSTPQEIELEAGVTETYTLIFLNYVKPGIHLKKLDSITMQPLANARFRITQVGGDYSKEFTTDINGEVDLEGLEPGSYTVVELAAPEGYLIDDAERVIRIEAGEDAEFIFTNTKKPSFRLVKIDSLTGERLAGATFRIAKVEDGSHYLDRVTEANGEINVSDLEPGVYSVQETMAPEGYVLDETEYHVELFPGQTSQIVVSNDTKPDLRIVKKDADTGKYLDGATFQVKQADGKTLTAEETNEQGEIVLKNMDPGVYEVTEQAPPPGYLPAREATQLITLEANKLGTVIFTNYEKPTLTVYKVSSVSGEPLKGAKFQIKYRSNNTENGFMSDLGYYLTDENGQFKLENLTDGWYTVTEIETVPGYKIREPATQELHIKGGEDVVLTFENTPLSALVVYKFDSQTGEAIPGAKFQVKRLSDTSGTGGTVIGTYTTAINGSFTVTGLQEGTYIVEEIASDSGHVIDSAPQTVYLSGKEQDVVEIHFGNSPKGALVIRKLDSVTNEPLEGVTFKITTATGDFVPDKNGKVSSNGLYYTDKAGEIILTGLSGTLVVTEVETIPGYTIAEATRTQTIVVTPEDTQTLTFFNDPTQVLTIQKFIAGTNDPLAGVKFLVTDSSGEKLGTNNGEFITDKDGRITITGLVAGTTVTAKETETVSGYVLDTTPKSIKIKQGEAQTLTFYNYPKGGLIVNKLDSVTKKPLEGAEFKITTAAGEPVPDNEGKTSTNGIYKTDANGQIVLLKLQPGAYVVTETKAPEGHVLNSTPQTVNVNADDTQTLTFLNEPLQVLTIQKYVEGTTTPIEGVKFMVTDGSGAALGTQNGENVTDSNGQIVITDIAPGTTVIARETRTVKGYTLNGTPQNIEIQVGANNRLVFYDEPLSTLVIHKYIDGTENEPLSGVGFEVTDGSGAGVGTKDGIYYANQELDNIE